MRITCPHCGFYKEIATGQIPANVVRVTCPECRQPFPLVEQSVDRSTHTVATDSTETQTEDIDNPAVREQDSPATLNQNPEETFPENRPGPEPADTGPTAAETAGPLAPASIAARYAALLIDAMLILIMVLSMRLGITLLGNGLPFEGKLLLSLIFTLFALILGFTYHTLFIGICGQTPGKRLMRIRVVTVDQSAMTYPRAMLREILGKTLSSTFLLGYLMALFHPQRLAAHDKIADTRVVNYNP